MPTRHSAHLIHLSQILAALAFILCSCATTRELKSGMTADQAIDAMGQPDLKDTVADPHGSGADVLRYAWVGQHKVATFGPDGRVASVGDLPTAGSAGNTKIAEAEITPAPSAPFDPIQTPLNYLFYPLKVGFTWVGAGINCVAEGECRRPVMKSPDAG